jgi:hypothetical protein
MRRNKLLFISVLIVLTAFLTLPSLYSEELTLTTYYPSPNGVYQDLEVHNRLWFYPDPTNPNNDHIYFYRTNPVADTSELRLLLADNYGSPNDKFIIGATQSGGAPGFHPILTITAKPSIDMHNSDLAVGNLTVRGWSRFTGCMQASTIAASGTVYGGGSGSCDLAEMIPAQEGVEAGDLVVIDPDKDIMVKKSDKIYNSKVAGIISENAAFVISCKDEEGCASGECEDADNQGNSVPLALAGRVMTKVTTESGPIKRGDLITTSSKPGYGMKLTLLSYQDAKNLDELKYILEENRRRKLAVVGKALQELDEGEGKIKVLVE